MFSKKFCGGCKNLLRKTAGEWVWDEHKGKSVFKCACGYENDILNDKKPQSKSSKPLVSFDD